MKIIQFVPRKKTLSGYNRNREYWLPAELRTRLTDRNRRLPIIMYLIYAFIHEIKERAEQGQLDLSCFPEFWDVEIYLKDFQLPIRAQDEISFLPYETQIDMVLNMIEYAHNGWVKDNSADFFGYYMGKEFMFLPIEIAGEIKFKSYYKVFESQSCIFGLDGIVYDLVQEAYYKRQRRILKKYNITDVNHLTDLIVAVCHDYEAFCPEIIDSLSQRAKAYEVGNQLMYYVPELLNCFYTEEKRPLSAPVLKLEP